MQNEGASQNVVSWNAIFGGCAMHGHGKEALKQFDGEVQSQMMLLLFVFCQFVAMQVWWMMACTASESVAMADKGNRCEQTPGLKYNKVHTLVVDDQDHPQVTSIMQN